MTAQVWKWFGIDGMPQGEAYELLTQLVETFFSSIESCLGHSLSASMTIDDFIQVGLADETEYQYFWDWFQNYGLSQIKDISRCSVDSTDEVLDFLESELRTLISVVDDGDLELIVSSLADAISEVHQFLAPTREIPVPILCETSHFTICGTSKSTHEIIMKDSKPADHEISGFVICKRRKINWKRYLKTS